jgi:hypothetical protein
VPSVFHNIGGGLAVNPESLAQSHTAVSQATGRFSVSLCCGVQAARRRLKAINPTQPVTFCPAPAPCERGAIEPTSSPNTPLFVNIEHPLTFPMTLELNG